MDDALREKVRQLKISFEERVRRRKSKENTSFNAGLGKRPRHYAEEILALKTREERIACLSKVPAVYRVWVEESVKDAFFKAHLSRRRKP